MCAYFLWKVKGSVKLPACAVTLHSLHKHTCVHTQTQSHRPENNCFAADRQEANLFLGLSPVSSSLPAAAAVAAVCVTEGKKGGCIGNHKEGSTNSHSETVFFHFCFLADLRRLPR